MILGIVPCSKEKIWDLFPNRKGVQAQFAYRSAFHTYTRKYAQLYCDQYLILSAKYGLMKPDFIIPRSYDVTFSRATDPYVSKRELRQQALRYPYAKKLIVLCPRAYAKRIEDAFSFSTIAMDFPLRGVGGFGAMHTFLKRAIVDG